MIEFLNTLGNAELFEPHRFKSTTAANGEVEYGKQVAHVEAARAILKNLAIPKVSLWKIAFSCDKSRLKQLRNWLMG
jgi:hypothetical protein